jgi:Transposase DDE domain
MQEHLFNKIEKALLSLHGKGLQGHALTRVKQLTGLICGMISTKSCHLHALGSGMIQDINHASRETAAKRFVENQHTAYHLHFLPYISVLLAAIIGKISKNAAQNATNHGLVFVIDGSQIGNKHVALMLGLVYEKRCIPICWVVKEGKKGHFSTDMHLELVRKVAVLLQPLFDSCAEFGKNANGPAMPITLLGDGEFDSADLQQLCRKELKWNYVFRTASDSLLYDTENDQCFQPKDIRLPKKEVFQSFTSVDFSAARLPDVHFLYWHEVTIHEKPIFLVSNYDDPFDIIFFYRQRFAIETVFKDLKSRGFNLHQTRLTKIVAIFNLILIAALGYCLLWTFGQQNKHHPDKKKVLRPHKNKPDGKSIELSIFSFGRLLFQYLLNKHKPFDFSFKLE